MTAGGVNISRILVGVDFGMSSAAALAYAHALSEHLDARLAVVFAAADSLQGADARTADGTLNAFTRQAAPRAIDCERIVIQGEPAPVILSAAQRSGADLIVLGSHGRGGMGRLALGSVAASVLRHTRTPVLIVRSTAELFVNGRILAAVDFSEASVQALAFAAALAGPAHATVDAFHALPFGEHHSPGHAVLTDDAMARLDALRADVVPCDVTSRSQAEMVSMGHPATAIAARAATSEARLIVVGGHREHRRVTGALGGTTERLLHVTPVPVLVVHPSDAGVTAVPS
jgi:nucleotide-binding universal stress UspA family protein